MTVRALGGLTVGAVVPGVALSVAQLSTLIAAQLSAKLELQAQLDGAVEFSIPDPTQLAAAVADAVSAFDPLAATGAAAGFAADLQTDIAASAALVAPAEALLSLLQGAIGVGGVQAYAFEGNASQLGAEVGAAVLGEFTGTTRARALVLVATTDAAWEALAKVLVTS